MKKTLALVLTVAVLTVTAIFGATIAKAEVQTGTTGDCTWTLDGTVLTISGNGDMGDCYPTPPWGTAITEVIIEDGVTSIGSDAFYRCSKLTSITIPDSVTSIGGSAFYGCSSLTSVTIPDSVTSIGGSAFYGCSSLTSVTIPDSVTSISIGAFYECSSLTSITIPDSVTSMDEYVFSYCSSLTSVTIGNSVTSIGNQVFFYCSSLTSVTIGNSVTSIGEAAFYNCSSLTSITIPDSVTTIGVDAFSYCSNLTSLTIGNGVTTIGKYAFEGCSNLTSLTIGNSVTSIDEDAFSYCLNLTSLTIGNSVVTIGKYAFEGCSSLTSITIPDSVISIGDYTFRGCSSLTSLTIGNSVTKIGEDAFDACSNLKKLYISSPYIVKQLNTSSDCGYLVANANTIFTNDETIEYAGTYISSMPYVTHNVVVDGISYTSYSNHICTYNKWMSDSENHWQICEGCDNVGEKSSHVFDYDCDTTCDICGYTRVTDHEYKTAWDKDDTKHWHECSVCGEKKDETDHIFDYACDSDCRDCGYVREAHHFVSIGTSHIINNDTEYPFSLSDGWYNSTNKADSSASTFTLSAMHDCTLVVKYKVSSEENYDKLVIKQNNTTLSKVSGTVSESELVVHLSEGDVLTLTYSKDTSTSVGTDTASFKIIEDSCSVNAEDVEADCLHPVICSGCGITVKPVTSEHSYDDSDDMICNICEYDRTEKVAEETFSSALEDYFANDGVLTGEYDVTGPTEEIYENIVEKPTDNLGVEYAGVNLRIDNGYFLRHHFAITAADYKIYVNDVEVELAQEEGYYPYYETSHEMGHLDEFVKITVEVNGETVDYYVSVYSYIAVTMKDSTDESAKTIVKALYDLNEAMR